MKKYTILLFISFGSCIAFTQEIISTQGNFYEKSEGSLSWTLGEPIIESLVSGIGKLTQGFHQTHLITTLVKDFKVESSVQVSPNPFKSDITIQLPRNSSQYSYSLFDMQGRKLLESLIPEASTKVDFSNLLPGIYFLNIHDYKFQIIKSFQIIKQ